MSIMRDGAMGIATRNMFDPNAIEVNKPYQITAQGVDNFHYTSLGVLISKKVKLRGIEYWWFQGRAFELLVRPSEIISLERVDEIPLRY